MICNQGITDVNPPYTISALARRFGLSRSTLLHYDRIGLLRPGGRNAAGYRHYTDADAERLRSILTYRRAGVPLGKTGELIDGQSSTSAKSILLTHLQELNRQIDELQNQQTRVLALLGTDVLPATPRLLTCDSMVAIFRAAGLDDEGMDRLHAHFERIDPDAHQRFLESLGLEPDYIARIREVSRASDS